MAEKYINPHTDFDRDIVNAIRTAEKKKYAEGRAEGREEGREEGRAEGRAEGEKKAKERIMEIRDKLMTMKWDVEHGQINPAKKVKYDNLKKEYEELLAVLEGKKEE